MLDSTGESISSQVSNIMSGYGIPQSVWGPILQVESGGNALTRSVTPYEDSVGLFQLNRMGGLGSGYSVTQLQDPTLNATLAARAMSTSYQSGVTKGLSGYSLTQYVAYNSGWPTMRGVNALQTDPVVKSYDAKLSAAYAAQGASSGVSAGSLAPTSLKGQLSALQAVQAGGGGTMGEVKSVGVMVLICVLGVVLIYLGVKMLSGETTVIAEGKGEAA